MRMNDDDLLPLYLYVFDGRGCHSGKQRIATMDECHDAMRAAVDGKQTVTITDSGDCCVFRCERGVVCWPRLDKLYCEKDAD